MCHVVGKRTAVIQLDDVSVYIHMQDNILKVESGIDNGTFSDGEGATDSSTILALLRGALEISEAILNDSLVIYGDIDQINRMFQAIEILLDVAPRCPALQNVSEQFVNESPFFDVSAHSLRGNWYPFALDSGEFRLLARYGLLPP